MNKVKWTSKLFGFHLVIIMSISFLQYSIKGHAFNYQKIPLNRLAKVVFAYSLVIYYWSIKLCMLREHIFESFWSPVSRWRILSFSFPFHIPSFLSSEHVPYCRRKLTNRTQYEDLGLVYLSLVVFGLGLGQKAPLFE